MSAISRVRRWNNFCRSCAIRALCFAACLGVHAQQPADRPSHAEHQRSAAQETPIQGQNQSLAHTAVSGPASPRPASYGQAAGTALDAAANPATVTFNTGQLKIETNNSDLGEILKAVSTRSGMTIDGTVRSARVYGVYGPGKPTEVLSDLLAGAGYNFIMVGGLSDGAPRELLLSARNNGPAATGSPRPNSVAHASEDDSDTTDEEQPGPGAIIHAPPPGPEDPQERMQQNLQRLQQMHDEQQKQQQQNSPQ